MTKTGWRLLTVIGLSMITSVVLSSGALADDERGCSNRTLRGDYGYAAEGVLLPAPGISIQFRGLGMTHFDGRGTLTWVEHTVVDGTPLEAGWTPASGTYTVNADCTGAAVVTTPNSPVPLHLAFVVVKSGAEIRTVLDAHAISTVFIRVKQ
jgi:hypothetical protein